MNWWKDLKGKVRLREPLKEHTTFKIGGPARGFIEPKDLADLKLLLRLAKRHKIALSIIGAGSNILVGDKGVSSLVVRLSAGDFKRLIFKDNRVCVGSGVLLPRLLGAALDQGLSGLEFLAGIPGTLGGALAMNAGSWGRNIKDVIDEVTVMDYNGSVATLSKKSISFCYRASSLSSYIILGARLTLHKDEKFKIKGRVKAYLAKRKAQQDLSYPSAGCVFKNPPGYSAGALIARYKERKDDTYAYDNRTPC